MLANASSAVLLAFVAALTAFGLVGGWLTIRALRRQSYERWPRPLRWLFYALLMYLVGAGTMLVVMTYAERLGVWHR